ncbi:hypothetical protein J4Q44_G00209890 [Coregonus suidteri]|uniref:Uncharacterized protein n=1 Tax=Coregonus suidteri TaxID=861788 RepID=A0AAN8LCY9_9TELE
MPLPRCLDTLEKRFYQSRDHQIRARHWAQFRAETLRVVHQGIVVLQRELELELERVREGLEGRRQRRERDHYSLAQVKRERQKKREEQIKGWMEKWMVGREEENQGEEGEEEGETEEEEKEESEQEEESEDEEGDTEGEEEKEKEEKVEEGDREGSEEEREEDKESEEEEEDGIETIRKEVKMQMPLMMADIERDMKNDYEQNKNREAQDRKMLTSLLQCLELVYQRRTEEILGKIGMLWDIMINNMLQDLHGRRTAQKSVSAQTAQYLHFCRSPHRPSD